MKDKFSFKLNKSIKVQAKVKGENTFIDLDKLYLKAPTYRHKDYTLVLKKRFLEALFGMTKSVDRDDAQRQLDSAGGNDDKLDSQAIKTILYAAEGFDIVAFYKKFEKFLTVDVCFKDEDHEQPISVGDLEKLAEDDFEDLIAKYVEVFFIVSWMKTLK
jgi:hypothetical protein